jgi:hypothetical protein
LTQKNSEKLILQSTGSVKNSGEVGEAKGFHLFHRQNNACIESTFYGEI